MTSDEKNTNPVCSGEAFKRHEQNKSCVVRDFEASCFEVCGCEVKDGACFLMTQLNSVLREAG